MLKIKRMLGLMMSVLLILPSTALAATGRGDTGRSANTTRSSLATNFSTGITVNELSGTLTPQQLVNKLLGGGVAVSNVKFTGKSGSGASAGTFSGGTGIYQFDSGIVLSTGAAKNIIGPNTTGGKSGYNGLSGDSTLNTLIPNYTTNDATVLEFDFVPVTSQITFKYQFASEEYNEYVGSSYNDVFGFFVNGKNIALIPGTTTPVSINNVNKGKNPATDPGKNPSYYINNDLTSGAKLNTEMDGMTVVLSATANVTPKTVNHIKLAIADAGDSALDSNVLIKAESFIASYTVAFNSNGGSAVPSQAVVYNGKAVKPANPTKAGYVFAGWYKDSALTNAFDFANTPITGNVTLYAKWTPAITVVPAPTNCRISFILSWNGVSGVYGYEVYRATYATGNYSIVANTVYTSIIDNGLVPGTTYYYKVRAYKFVGTTKVYSNWTPIISAKVN